MSTATIAAPAALSVEDELRADLIDWINTRGPRSRHGYSTERVAGIIIANLWGPKVREMIDGDDSEYLWHRCENVKDPADLTDAEAWDEQWHHGNLRDDIARGVAS